jgi:hypothetical protein
MRTTSRMGRNRSKKEKKITMRDITTGNNGKTQRLHKQGNTDFQTFERTYLSIGMLRPGRKMSG